MLRKAIHHIPRHDGWLFIPLGYGGDIGAIRRSGKTT